MSSPEGRADTTLRGSETVLLVEDEATLRMLIRRMLEKFGYTVLEAGHGREALALCERHEGPIDVVVTDVVMPEMGGRELAEQLAARRGARTPPVVYISGYPGSEGLVAQTSFLQKPFSFTSLVRTLRETLDATRRR